MSNGRTKDADRRASAILDQVRDRRLPVTETLVFGSDLDPIGSAAEENALFNSLGLELARRFQDGTWDWEYADGIANDLFAQMTLRWKSLPDGGPKFYPALFWRVFEAFDGGEYRRQKDGSRVDPAKKYTNPAIADVLQHDWPIDE